MLIPVRNLGMDFWSRPTLQNTRTGTIYADINCGDGEADWHACTDEGEPLVRISKKVVFQVIEEVIEEEGIEEDDNQNGKRSFDE